MCSCSLFFRCRSFSPCWQLVFPLFSQHRYTIFVFLPAKLVSFTAETRGCLKCKISSRLTWRGGRTYGRTPYGRFSQNQNFLDAWITRFSYPWCSASRARELRYDCERLAIKRVHLNLHVRPYTSHTRPPFKNSKIFLVILPWLEPFVNEHPLVSDRYTKTLEYRGPLNA